MIVVRSVVGASFRSGQCSATEIEIERFFVLFNDALNTFYLRLYGVTHMVKDHSDSERGNSLPPHGILIPISSKGSFICIIPQTGWHIPRPLLHSRRSLAGTRNSSMSPPWRIDPTTHRVMSERSYHGATSRSLRNWCNKDRGMCYPVGGVVYIKDPLPLIGKSNPCSRGRGFPHSLSEWFSKLFLTPNSRK